MKRLALDTFTVVVIAACFIGIAASAQSEKVGLRMVPRPNQTVRIRMVQESEVDISFDGTSTLPPGLTGPVKLATKLVVAITQRSGPATREGHIVAELSYDEMSSEMTMNGQPTPSNDPTGGFIGKKVTVTFNKDGGVVDIKVPADTGVPEESFRQILKSMYGNMPATALAVGESTMAPLDFTLPLPIPGAAPLKMDGDIRHTLVSVEKDSTGRVAKFDHSISGKMVSAMEMPSPDGKVNMSLDFALNGGGSMLRDLDRGFIRSSETKSTFEGKINIAGEPNTPHLPSMDLHGTTKTTTISEN